jgi:hypothetical protein
MYAVERLVGTSPQALEELLAVYRAGLPASWHYADAASYYAGQLQNPRAIHLLLRRAAEPVGYLLAIPHDEAIAEAELRGADPERTADPERLYVETMEIVPECARTLTGGRLCLLLLDTLGKVAGQRGLNRFSMHARVSSGLSRAVRRIYGDMVTCTRRIESWPFYNGEEPTEYIELTYRGRLRGGARRVPV